MNPPPTPAGWYPDGNVLRYWDGRTWTAQTAPLLPTPVVAPPTPQDSPQPAGAHPAWKRKRVLLPVTGLAVLGLLGFLGSLGGGTSSSTAPVPLAGSGATSSVAPASDDSVQQAAATTAAAQQASEKAASEKAAADKAAAEKAAVDKAAAEKAAADKAAAEARAQAAATARVAAQKAAAQKAAAQKAAEQKAAAQQAAAKAAANAAADQAAAEASRAAAVASSLDPRFPTCKAANAAGYGPYRQGADPEYDWYRDADHDGLDCER